MDTYKEKYNAALEQAKKELATCGSMDCEAARLIFRLFPQLAESEDERIRKGLIEALKTSKTVGELKFILPEPTREECIAYLEKQKELPFVKDVVLGLPGLYYYDGERMHFQGSPATEENPYDFAMSQQEKQKEQKPAEWSEEDEEKMNSISEIIEHCVIIPYSGGKLTVSKEYKKELQRFLKSFRPSWKPSEEQMEALQCAIVFMEIRKASDYDMTPLKELYEQLKAL